MISTTGPTSQWVTALSDALDEEASLLGQWGEQLEELSSAILGRGDRDLEELLGRMECTRRRQREGETRLSAASAGLARALACDAAPGRLSDLIDRLGDAQRDRLEPKRRRVVEQIALVRRTHLRSAVLLSECARVNRELLERLLPKTAPLTTYGAGGRVSRRGGAGLISTES